MSPEKELLTYTAKMFRDNPARWGKGAFARTKDGNSVRFSDSEAASFCLYGGLMRAEYELNSPRGTNLLAGFHVEKTVKETGGGLNVFKWNDAANRKVEDVIDVLEKAAARCPL